MTKSIWWCLKALSSLQGDARIRKWFQQLPQEAGHTESHHGFVCLGSFFVCVCLFFRLFLYRTPCSNTEVTATSFQMVAKHHVTWWGTHNSLNRLHAYFPAKTFCNPLPFLGLPLLKISFKTSAGEMQKLTDFNCIPLSTGTWTKQDQRLLQEHKLYFSITLVLV